MLPGVSLTDVRPPPAPVVRKADAGRAWGAPPEPARPVPPSPAPPPAPTLPPAGREPEPVLDVPESKFPAFLSADLADEELGLDPQAPFAWRHRSTASTPSTPSSHGTPVASAAQEPQTPEEPLEDEEPPSFEETQPAGLSFIDDLTRPMPATPPAPPSSAPVTAALDEEAKAKSAAAPDVPQAPSRAAPELPSVEFVRQPSAAPPAELSEPAAPAEPAQAAALALEEDTSPAAVLQAKSRKAPAPEREDSEAGPAEAEVSFVRAARRKAFWRKPAVRATLGLCLLAATAALALQVAVHERDRIAAMDARTRPWLMKLCEPLGCRLAPLRRIADVVIDSSSFNKARGDSYQLALAMKSQSAMALAMPAVELTLTDAQDQPVLRRVLLPADMGAPAELAAHGEWSTSVSVIVTTGGARVAGYRLLAFYP